VINGNLVAVDTDGVTPINEIHPTAFTQVATEKSSSTTIAAEDVSSDLWGADPDLHNEPNTMGRKLRGNKA
jgi:hypothetical protein